VNRFIFNFIIKTYYPSNEDILKRSIILYNYKIDDILYTIMETSITKYEQRYVHELYKWNKQSDKAAINCIFYYMYVCVYV